MTRLNQGQTAFLDGVRGVCAQLVMLGHAYMYAFRAELDVPVQSLAVAIFFLLSGFLIGYSAFSKFAVPDYGFRHYMSERFARLYVALVPALFLALALDLLAVDQPGFAYGADMAPQHFFGSLLMLQDFPVFQILRRGGLEEQWWFVTSFGSAKPLWTISIEFWIYVVFGLAVFVLARGSLRRNTWWALPLLAVAAIEPAYHFFSGYGQCLTMMWIIGAVLAWTFLRWQPSQPVRIGRCEIRPAPLLWTIALVSLVSFAGRAMSRPVEFYDLQYIVYVAGVLFALLFLLRLAPSSIPGWLARSFAFLANYSYSLYLTHNSVVVFLHAYLQPSLSPESMMMVDVLASNAAALSFWWLFERHHRAVAAWLRGALSRNPSAATPVYDKT